MQRKARGFTLIELLLCFAVLVLLSGFTTPAFKRSLDATIAQTYMQQLTRSLQHARASAVTQAVIVSVCRSLDQRTCGGNWNDGAISFTDHNGNHEPDGDDVILQVISAPRSGHLKLRSFPNRQYIQFTPMGFTKGQTGNFTWCPESLQAEQARQLIFSHTGRIRAAVDRDNDGVREAANGSPLSCS